MESHKLARTGPLAHTRRAGHPVRTFGGDQTVGCREVWARLGGVMRHEEDTEHRQNTELQSLASSTMTPTPGRYELVCDQPWHYAAGVFDAFTVR